jgi:uncharacterized repeat protein (TIGR03803 family)
MKKNRLLTAVGRMLAVVTVALIVISVLAPGASAATEKVLHSFTGGSDGQAPDEGLIWDQAGNLYSATLDGGVGSCRNEYGTGCGVVYQLTPNADGTWTENVLHRFKGGQDGSNPTWGNLTFDSAGNLYGTTNQGGKYGQGTVFELTPDSHGNWTKTVLHNFKGKSDGTTPMTTLVFDNAGAFYGTAVGGGAHGGGTVFKMTPGSNNHWNFHVIHEFARKLGFYPWAGLTPGPDGAFYGTTRDDGYYCSHDCGTVYELTPTSGGKWTYKVIHRFRGGKDGADPGAGGLVLDSQGNLFGDAEIQGAYGYGLIYELTPGAGDKWTFQVLYQFTGGEDGGFPQACTLIFDAAGNLYGPAKSGGAYGYGVVFKLTPNQDGTWTESVVYDFGGSDGASPGAALNSDPSGNIYGITTGGGAYGYGAVYEITP